MRKRAYERICLEVEQARARGDLSLLQFVVLCHLALAADYQGGAEPEYAATTLAALRDRLGLDGDEELSCSEDSLYRALRGLKRLGFIDYDTRTGTRARYHIRLKFDRAVPTPWSRRGATETQPKHGPQRLIAPLVEGTKQVPTPTPTRDTPGDTPCKTYDNEAA